MLPKIAETANFLYPERTTSGKRSAVIGQAKIDSAFIATKE